MTLYTFHAYRADGAPLLWDAAPCDSCDAARDRAAAMLETHLSAETVAVWRGDVQVAVLERPQAWSVTPAAAPERAACPQRG